MNQPGAARGAEDSHRDGGELLYELRGRITPLLTQTLEQAASLGMIGGSSVAEQIDHAVGFAVALELALGRAPQSLLDLGTGGGLPGLVLHGCWPTTRVVLLDANERRTDFLRSRLSTADDLGAVEVVRGRAEEIGRQAGYREGFETVTARSFGAPAVTAECGAPLLSPGGLLVVSDPPGPPDPRRWPSEGLAELGLGCGESVRVDGRFGYRILPKIAPIPDRFPRRVGMPAKRPLF